MPSQAVLELLIQMRDEASSGLSSLGGAMGNVGMIAGGAALAGVVALGAAIVGGTGDALEARAIFAETEQIIKNTGGAAGVTAQEVADLAASLSDAAGMSLFGDDQIQGAENVILKFKELKVPIADVTQLSLDMAQTLGSAPADAAKTLGIALQSPFDASAKLAKQGIILTESQNAALEAFKASGDAAGAQTVLMDALNATYGGQAQAAAKAAGGMVQFKAGLGEAFETIGGKLLPVLDKFGVWLNSPEVQKNIGIFADRLATGIEIAANFIVNDLVPAITDLYNWLAPILGPIIAEIARALSEDLPRGIERVTTGWANLKQGMADFKTSYIDPIVRGWEAVTGAISTAYDWFGKIGGAIGSIQIPSWLQGHSPPPLAEWIDAIGASASTATPTMQEFMRRLGDGGEAARAQLETLTGAGRLAFNEYVRFAKESGDVGNDALMDIPAEFRRLAEMYASSAIGQESTWGKSQADWAAWSASTGGAVPDWVNTALPSGVGPPGSGAGGIIVNVTVQGNVTSERDLILAIRDGLAQLGRQNVTIFGAT